MDLGVNLRLILIALVQPDLSDYYQPIIIQKKNQHYFEIWRTFFKVIILLNKIIRRTREDIAKKVGPIVWTKFNRLNDWVLTLK